MDTYRLVAVQRLLSNHYPSTGPGAAFLLVERGRPLMLAGFGLADVPALVPVTPCTLFDLASVSKQITTYAILLFVEQQRLQLSDPVCQYIPELAELHGEGRPLRVSDLVFHSSGLPDYTTELSADEYVNFTNARLIDWLIEQRELDFAPGTRGICHRDEDEDSTYCNTNYALLATIVERLAGVGFAFFLKTRLFDPLGMNDTFCDPWQHDHSGQARRYDQRGQLISQPRVIPVVGDGNVYSTVADLYLWDQELTRPTLVSPESLARLWQAGQLDDGTVGDYGWGWYLKSYPGRRVAWHSGSWDGANNCYSRWLDDGLHLILLSNTHQQSATKIVGEIEEILLDR